MEVICTNAGECFYGTSSTPRMQRESSAFKCDHCEPHVHITTCEANSNSYYYKCEEL